MASSIYDTDTLLNRVKRIESIPTAQNVFTESDIVDLMNMEFQEAIVPLILSVNEEYFVFSEDNTVTANTASLDLPSNAIGMRARDIYWVDTTNNNFATMPRLTPEQIAGSNGFGFANGSGAYGGYYLQQNKIMLYPVLQGPGTIRINYFRRPNNLCLIDDAGEVTDIDYGTGEVTLDQAPDTSTWNVGTTIDFINSVQPFECTVTSATITARSRLVFTFDPTEIADVVVGNWAAAAGSSPFPQYIPVEAMNLIVQGAAMRCLEALGDKAGWANALVKYQMMEQNLLTLITPRIVGQPKKIVGGGGIIGASRSGFRNWR